MKNLLPLLLLGLAAYTFPAEGCTGQKGTVHAAMPGYVAWNITEAVLTPDDVNPTPDTDKVPRSQCTQCNGTGKITHGDGHQTDCPHCYAFFGPVPLEQLTYVDWRVPLGLPANSECDCEKCECSPCNCSGTPKGSPIQTAALRQGCASGSCGTAGAGNCDTGPTRDPGAGGCAAGACGSSAAADGPRFRGPVRRIGGFFQERRPVRRFLGRLFGRR